MRSLSNKTSMVPALLGLAVCGMMAEAPAGPYSAAIGDPTNPFDAPVPGFTGPHGPGMVRLDTGFLDANNNPIYENPDNHVNPVFFAWVDSIADYQPALPVSEQFADSAIAIGPVTGDHFGVVSLGDMSATSISEGNTPGSITLQLARPVRNFSGADFVVFENGAIAQSNFGGAGIGGIFGELAYVEVSANGVDFVRFPSASLTTSALGAYGSIDPTQVRNLAGKHVNAYGKSWGTPFDLAEIGLAQITHVRLVDIPGNGSFQDSNGNPVYDPWKTIGSGGFDLEAVGAISTGMTFGEWPQLAILAPEQSGPGADPDRDGMSNLLEYAFATLPWKPDISPPRPAMVDGRAEITFIRDERLLDLVYEVQATSTLESNTWITIASSTAGAPVQGVNGHSPVISESPAEGIRSIGVIRKVAVRDVVPIGSGRFLRVKVIQQSVSIPGE